jgi:hypothetical protein
MQKTNDIKSNFSALLRDSLKSRFGRIPSAAVIAREFNLRAYNTDPISQESARRWIRGVSLPEEERLRVLVNWLDLDFNSVLRPRESSHALGLPNGQQYQNGNGHLNQVRAQQVQKQMGNHQHHDLDWSIKSNGHETSQLLELFKTLDDHQKQLVIDLIQIGFKKEGNGDNL